MATIIVTPSAPAEMRVMNPIIRKRPPMNSTLDTNGARMFGAGMCQPAKFSMIAGRLWSLPQPVDVEVTLETGQNAYLLQPKRLE
jgi:hypothetical protein